MTIQEDVAELQRTRTLVQTRALVVALEWAAGDQRALVLAGGPGTGKSWAAAAAMPRAAWYSATAIARLPHWELGSPVEPAWAVVDDLGREPEDRRDVVRGVLEDRYDAGRRTIVTCNGTPDVVRALLGQRLVDRMRESGRLAHFIGESLRGQQLAMVPAPVTHVEAGRPVSIERMRELLGAAKPEVRRMIERALVLGEEA